MRFFRFGRMFGRGRYLKVLLVGLALVSILVAALAVLRQVKRDRLVQEGQFITEAHRVLVPWAEEVELKTKEAEEIQDGIKVVEAKILELLLRGHVLEAQQMARIMEIQKQQYCTDYQRLVGRYNTAAGPYQKVLPLPGAPEEFDDEWCPLNEEVDEDSKDPFAVPIPNPNLS